MRYVYLVRAGENQYKIGVSRDVNKRVAALQTSNIHLVEVICAKKTSEHSTLEKSLHKKVREFGGNGGKEWLHLTPEQALEVAIEITKSPEVDIAESIIKDLKNQIASIIEKYEEKLFEERKLLEEERRLLTEDRAKSLLKIKKNIQKPELHEMKRQADENEYQLAKELVISSNTASTSFLQRRMRIGYGKASRIIDRLEEEGVISPLDGIKRVIL
jgi:DNA segregation ATPase FtsK/SpoIIIE-like protein